MARPFETHETAPVRAASERLATPEQGRQRSNCALLLTFTCLALAAPAGAQSNWVGAQLHVPVPARDIGDSRLGVDAGVTLTQMGNAYFGFGVDLIHHDWPASRAYVTAFDRYLRSQRMESLVGSEWVLSALQMTGHLRLVAPARERYKPWMQVGAGVYRLNLNLDQRRPEGTYAWVGPSGMWNIKHVPGAYAGVGLDLHISSAMVLGVDAAFHYVWARQKATWGWISIDELPDFSAVTVGTHARFGWK